MRRCLFDIESDNLYETVTRCHVLVIRDLDTNERLVYREHQIADALKQLDLYDWVSGHNIIDFDLPVLLKLYGWKPRAEVVIRDTLVISALIFTNLANDDMLRIKRGSAMPAQFAGSHGLKAWGYRLGILKGTFGETNTWEQWSQEMEDYCIQDVEVNCRLLDLLLGKNYSEVSIQLEMDFKEVIVEMERVGVTFDCEAAKDLHVKLAARREEIAAQLQAAFPPDEEPMKTPAYWLGVPSGMFADGLGECQYDTKKQAKAAGCDMKSLKRGPNKIKLIEFNPASRSMIADRFIRRGWKPTQLTKGGSPSVDEDVLELLETDSRFPEAKLLNEYLMLEKRLGQLVSGKNAWLKLVDSGGRIHGSLNTNGAVTGRCTHYEPNLAQVPKVGSLWGKEYRSLFAAQRGFVLVGADASGLELRALSHYLFPYDGGRYADLVLNGDVHTANQLAAGLSTRNEAKTFIYALIYGAGNEKLGSPHTIQTRLSDALEAEAATVVIPAWALRSMAKHGEVTKERMHYWKRGYLLRSRFEDNITGYSELVAAVHEAVDECKSLRGVDGRRLHCRSKHSSLNTLLQSCGAVAVKLATVLADRNLRYMGLVRRIDFSLLLHVHDEMQTETKPALAETVGKTIVQSIREAGEQLKLRIKLDGEYKIGANWAATH